MARAHEAILFLYHDVLQAPLAELPLPQPPRLLDRLRQALRVRHDSPRSEDSYDNWVVRHICFHALRHPNIVGAVEIEMFLTDRIQASKVAEACDTTAPSRNG
jgi:hypothetical protein